MAREPEYTYNLTGKVKSAHANGWGFIIVDDGQKAGVYSDIFFHVSSLQDDVEWSSVAVGQKVHIGTAIKNDRGWQATEVTFMRAS